MRRNIPRFIAFRLLFNARFYYPVFAVIQLDYGLTMAQFAVLNAVWAVSIVVLEVPSGALADRWGRKRMVVLASLLMVLEMALLAFVPLGNPTLVFWVWILNRVLSGAAEASASGADEALAYDSLEPEEREREWPRILTRLMMWSSGAFVTAMLLGAAVYDEQLVNRVLAALGSDAVLSRETVIRFPVYLTLTTAIAAVAVTLGLQEPARETRSAGESSASWRRNILRAAVWIWRTPVVFALLLAALVRLFLTMNSEYYRLISIPEAWFGVLGAFFAGMGMLTPRIAQWLVSHGRREQNYLLISLLTFLGLLGVAQAWPYYGVLVVVFFGFAFGFLNYFTSHYLNREVDSRYRATVLSFKGLALNLGFGAVSLLYGLLLRSLRGDTTTAEAEASDSAFRESLTWLPWGFLVLLTPLVGYGWVKVNRER